MARTELEIKLFGEKTEKKKEPEKKKESGKWRPKYIDPFIVYPEIYNIIVKEVWTTHILSGFEGVPLKAKKTNKGFYTILNPTEELNLHKCDTIIIYLENFEFNENNNA